MGRLNTEQGQEGLHTLGAQCSSAQDVWCRGRGGWSHSDGDVIRGNDITAAARVCYNI